MAIPDMCCVASRTEFIPGAKVTAREAAVATFHRPSAAQTKGMPPSLVTRGGVRSIARRLLVQRALILVYHRVTRLESDPECLCVQPERFLEQLQVLRRHYRVVRLTDLQRLLEKGLVPRKRAVVTFDDGYADNLLFARPLLERCDITATCFVASGKMGQRSEFWWDELAHLLLDQKGASDVLSIDLNGTCYTWRLRQGQGDGAESNERVSGTWNVLQKAIPNARQKAYGELAALLRTSDVTAQDSVLEQVAACTRVQRHVRDSHRTLRPDEVASLGEGGLVEIGAHTVTHPVLSAQPLNVQQHEIETAKQQLESILNRKVSAFAYPFGQRADYSAETVAMVRNAGYVCACSNFPGWVRRETNAYELPRYIVRNWHGDEFARRLEGWYAN